MDTRKNIFLWTLYDFANSLVSIVFFLYFAQWIVVDRGMPDIYFNLTFTVAAVLLLFTVPVTGFLLDKYFRRITGLRYATLATSLLYGACALAAVFSKDIPALIFFTLGLYTYLLTFTFYTPLINDISKPEKRGKVSGMGIAANYLGQFTGLLLALPFSNGTLSLFGSAPRTETLLPAVVLFTILALPMLIWFREPKKEKIAFQFKSEFKGLFSETKKLFLFPGIALFMLAYFLFNDAILTASNNFPIFLEQVWAVSDTVKTYILLGIIFTSALGGLMSGVIADRFGHKRTLVFITSGWIVILPLIGFISNFTLFIITTTVMGLWFGSNWAVSRSVMSYLAPPQGHNLAFAYFGLVERASSFVGPVVWGLMVTSLVSIGSDRYRFATLAVTLFIVFGLIALLKVRSDRKATVDAQGASKPKIHFISGVCGVGKSAIIPHLKSILPREKYDVRDFDERGVPDGADHAWRKSEVKKWLEIGALNGAQGISTIICGFVKKKDFEDDLKEGSTDVGMIFLDADAETIRKRLIGRYSKNGVLDETQKVIGKPVTEFIESNVYYCNIMKKEGEAEGVKIIDTSDLTPEDVAKEVMKFIEH